MKPVPHGEPYAGKLHVRFDEGAGVPDNKGRPALLYTLGVPPFPEGSAVLAAGDSHRTKFGCRNIPRQFGR